MAADPSENVCVELLRPKTVPEDLVALGTVVQVTEVHIKLQITGGIICIVDAQSVNQIYAASIEQHVQAGRGLNAPPRLDHLFKRGQQYICKVIERRARKGYADAQDIIATLNPADIMEDTIPKIYLSIPQIPIQGVVQSIEDHGYQMDIGFKGVTGFLAFSEIQDAPKEKFCLGQVIRCCTKSALPADDSSRVVQLSLNKEMLVKSKFSQEKVNDHMLNEACILPGAKSFLTVMKVRRDGLIVNFMNEFAGFVSASHLRDDWHTPQDNYKISDTFPCRVLYYNKLTKTFALSIKHKPKDKLKYFIQNYQIGQIIKRARVSHIDGIKAVIFKLDDSNKAIANIRDCLDTDVATMTKDEILTELDTMFPEKSKHTCRIKSINLADMHVILSLRKEFLEMSHVSVEQLEPADLIEAQVKKHVKDGIVVSFGLNLRAIILNQDLHELGSANVHKKYPINSQISCRVLKVDHRKQPPKVYLTNKQQLMDPNLDVVDSYDVSHRGKTTHATVIKVRPDGLIVELFNNVKGFVPVRFMSHSKIGNTHDLFKAGQVAQSCVVYEADASRRRLLLGLVELEAITKAKKDHKKAKAERKELKKLAKINGKAAQTSNKRKLESSASDTKSNKKLMQNPEPIARSSDMAEDEDDKNDEIENNQENSLKIIKSRRIRSEEAALREEALRKAERDLLDPNREPQSVPDFERLLIKSPNSADAWIKYSKYFLDNVETEKARIVCRRALRQISFRLEREKLKVWLFLIKIEAKYGGVDKLRGAIEEAAQVNDLISLNQGAAKVLAGCNQLDEAERLHELLLKSHGSKSCEVWNSYLQFLMEHKKEPEKARALYAKASKSSVDSEPISSRMAQLEFRFGSVERGKTMFENLLSNCPKRTDLWNVYAAMIKKYGTREVDTDDVREHNEQILNRIAENIDVVAKKSKKLNKRNQIKRAVAV